MTIAAADRHVFSGTGRLDLYTYAASVVCSASRLWEVVAEVAVIALDTAPSSAEILFFALQRKLIANTSAVAVTIPFVAGGYNQVASYAQIALNTCIVGVFIAIIIGGNAAPATSRFAVEFK